jgi:hypothetical protein
VPVSALAQDTKPEIDSVSVNLETRNVMIAWSIENTTGVDSFLIYRQIFGVPGITDGAFMPIIKIENPETSFWEDNSELYNGAKPFQRSVTYQVEALKHNPHNDEMSEPHSTIFISDIKFDYCEISNTIEWSKYLGWGNNVSKYQVFTKEEDNSFIFVSEVSGLITTYEHSNVQENINYEYFVRAVHSDGLKSSTSNDIQVFTEMPKPADTINADYATVVEQGRVDLSFTIDPEAPVDEYVLYKSESLAGNYYRIAGFDNSSSSIEYSDFVATSDSNYYYKLTAVNTCGVDYKSSNVAGNIVLHSNVKSGETPINSLEWTPYKSWLGAVEEYIIYRSVDGDLPVQIGSVSGDETTYKDDVSNCITETAGKLIQGNFCYYVEAREGDFNPYNIKGISRSCVSCCMQNTLIFIPNAFNPYSAIAENRYFKPLLSFAKDFNMVIYNRWGDLVFTSNNATQGWNGETGNGEYAKKGVYIYYIEFTSENNETIKKRGTVAIVY